MRRPVCYPSWQVRVVTPTGLVKIQTVDQVAITRYLAGEWQIPLNAAEKREAFRQAVEIFGSGELVQRGMFPTMNWDTRRRALLEDPEIIGGPIPYEIIGTLETATG